MTLTIRSTAAMIAAGALVAVAAATAVLAGENAFFRAHDAADARTQVRLFEQQIAPYHAGFTKATRELDAYLRSRRSAQQRRR